MILHSKIINEKILSVSAVIIFIATGFGCKSHQVRGEKDFYRVNQRVFPQVELRFGEQSNQSCVVHLTREGVLFRVSRSYYSGDNEYIYTPMIEIDSSIIGKIQRLVINNDYFEKFESCYCPEGSDLVEARIISIQNPLTNCSNVIYDKNYMNKYRDDKEGKIDTLFYLLASLVPEDFKDGFCW